MAVSNIRDITSASEWKRRDQSEEKPGTSFGTRRSIFEIDLHGPGFRASICPVPYLGIPRRLLATNPFDLWTTGRRSSGGSTEESDEGEYRSGQRTGARDVIRSQRLTYRTGTRGMRSSLTTSPHKRAEEALRERAAETGGGGARMGRWEWTCGPGTTGPSGCTSCWGELCKTSTKPARSRPSGGQKAITSSPTGDRR
jgi:hypothetical protein